MGDHTGGRADKAARRFLILVHRLQELLHLRCGWLLEVRELAGELEHRHPPLVTNVLVANHHLVIRCSSRGCLVEGVIGLYKTEVIRRRGPWRGLEDVEDATLEWVDWCNTQRLLEPIAYVPPLEHERNYYRQQQLSPTEAALN